MKGAEHGICEIIKRGQDEGKEKHIPTITLDKGCHEDKNIVRVVVGHEVSHPNTLEHHILWIELYGVKKANETSLIGTFSGTR